MLTHERLKSLLRYDPETGVFTWLVSGKRMRVGDAAGCPNGSGYIAIGLDRGLYLGHRLAWFYVTGEWPTRLDHEDRNRSNNRWKNLRPATHKQNMENRSVAKNSTSGVSGVTWITAKGMWRAQIQHHRKFVHLGYFHEFGEAKAARLAAEQVMFTHAAQGVA